MKTDIPVSPGQPVRIKSIDIFRAVTMVLMIFVNDFWTLEDIPGWLKHMRADQDALGFSDIIFPGFLFIVGLSIPFAIDKRLQKENSFGIFRHIVARTVALLVMGVFMVNLENIYPGAMYLPKPLWQILMIVAFILIWNNYKLYKVNKRTSQVLVSTGVILLIFLAVAYRGGDAEDIRGMRRYWWGILGLIGWAYFYSATFYLLCKGKLWPVILVALFFLVYNLLQFTGLLSFMEALHAGIWMPGDGAFVAFTMMGVVASVLYKHKFAGDHRKVILSLVVMGSLLLIYGFLVRPYYGISKIRATPSWIGICTGISLYAYAFFYWLNDVKNVVRWANIISPAGRSTLTCYLVPYVYYAVWSIWAISLPAVLRTGIVGLVKSMVFALLIVGITGLLNRMKISLKI